MIDKGGGWNWFYFSFLLYLRVCEGLSWICGLGWKEIFFYRFDCLFIVLGGSNRVWVIYRCLVVGVLRLFGNVDLCVYRLEIFVDWSYIFV